MQEIQTTLPIGTIVHGRYRVEEILGKGGFSAVYLVRDQRVKQNVFALKELIDSSKLERERFTFEGEVLKRLDHPALPRIYRVFDDEKSGRAYMLMDYVEGSNLEMLRQRQPDKRFALPQVLFFMAPIMDAVAYLHHQHPPIVHRDIKPANIIASNAGDGTVLVDFGIAKEYDPNSTTTAIRRASPGYGAPEQYSRGTNVRTDIYGLGATLYALLTGTVPADAFYRMTQLGSRGVDPLVLVHQLVPSIPRPVSDAITRALSMRSEDRFPTVEAFWSALNASPAGQQAPAGPVIIPPGAVYTAGRTENAATAPQQIRPRPAGPQRRNKLGLFLLLLAALLIGAGIAAAFFAFTGNHQATSSPTATVIHRPTPTAKPTHQPTATSRPAIPTSTPRSTARPATPTPVPPSPVYPQVAGVHSGTIHNATAGVNASMSLSLQQNGRNISGSFNVSLPLIGSGPLTGSVDTGRHIQFVVHSSQVGAPLFFQGTVRADGSMSGTYCSLNRANQCDPAAGGSGTWFVNAEQSPSSSVPGGILALITEIDVAPSEE